MKATIEKFSPKVEICTEPSVDFLFKPFRQRQGLNTEEGKKIFI